MLQALPHSHGDLFSLSGYDNAPMDSMERHRREVGKRIAALREEKGLTQPQLAEKAGIKQPSLWAIENGRTVEVTARTFLSLCRALGTTWEYLWDGAEVDAEEAQNEAQLVAIYRELAPAGKLAVLNSANAVREAFSSAPSKKQATFKLGSRESLRTNDKRKGGA